MTTSPETLVALINCARLITLKSRCDAPPEQEAVENQGQQLRQVQMVKAAGECMALPRKAGYGTVN